MWVSNNNQLFRENKAVAFPEKGVPWKELQNAKKILLNSDNKQVKLDLLINQWPRLYNVPAFPTLEADWCSSKWLGCISWPCNLVHEFSGCFSPPALLRAFQVLPGNLTAPPLMARPQLLFFRGSELLNFRAVCNFFRGIQRLYVLQTKIMNEEWDVWWLGSCISYIYNSI